MPGNGPGMACRRGWGDFDLLGGEFPLFPGEIPVHILH